ncbi:MAG: ATP-dependent protease LonB [archaeon]|nr:ATP-dependent protease LonB [archaeon]MDD3084436.1 ATP-dependent protease LonB [Candidatus ainarchaeum sp.]MDD4220898.1 ATP-dependent protease LonB [Candidatus ainarchaeum sp.]
MKETKKIDDLEYTDTSQIKIPKLLIDQVIGQDSAVNLIKKVANQKRHIMLVGEPGTGKSMIASALAEIMPTNQLKDLLVYPNNEDSHNPLIREVNSGEGKKIVDNAKLIANKENSSQRLFSLILPMGWLLLSIILWQVKIISDIVFGAMLILSGFIMIAAALTLQMSQKTRKLIPKLLINNANKRHAPYVDATGARAGALLGDVLHDPLQSGGLGTPPHLRVIPGMIHRANEGVLFLDEIATLSPKSQQELLTILQEKKYSISGQSEMSSGAMVRTKPAPCNFILVAAGNYQDLEKIHPAIRSRIRGTGYECQMNVDVPDTPENRNKIVQFVAQEISKDKKIPHFTKRAVEEIIFEARKKATRKNHLTLKLRELGGLIRAAGDLAIEKDLKLVTEKEVINAKGISSTLEQQMVQKMMEIKKDYDIYKTKGSQVGRVNGLAVMGSTDVGIMLPIECEVTTSQSVNHGKVIATGKLGDIAKESVQNVSAIFKKMSGKNISNYDVHIQFLQTHGVEGDSASISIASAVISVLEQIPINQDVAMTGSLSIRGEVLPVGGVTGKITAAINSKIKKVLIPYSNREDVVLSSEDIKKIEIIPVKNISEVIKYAFKDSKKKEALLKKIKDFK